MQLSPLTDDLGIFDTVVLDRQKLNEKIAERIQLQITDGKLKPGDRLPPNQSWLADLGLTEPRCAKRFTYYASAVWSNARMEEERESLPCFLAT